MCAVHHTTKHTYVCMDMAAEHQRTINNSRFRSRSVFSRFHSLFPSSSTLSLSKSLFSLFWPCPFLVYAFCTVVPSSLFFSHHPHFYHPFRISPSSLLTVCHFVLCTQHSFGLTIVVCSLYFHPFTTAIYFSRAFFC